MGECMNVVQDQSLLNFNTLKLTSIAKYFIELDDISIISQIKGFLQSNKLNYIVLGGGSNLLLPEYYSGVIIKNNLKGIQIIAENHSYIRLKVMAGEVWDNFVQYAVDKGYYGIENLSLIPGSVGASPVQNIGAYGVDVSSVIEYVELYDLISGDFIILDKIECDFKYRYSIFKRKQNYIITAVCFTLSKNKQFNYNYADLKYKLGDLSKLTIKKVRDTIIEIRSSKLPDWNILGNVGSFFHNPIIDKKLINKLLIKYPNIVYYEESNKDLVKVSAGWLIDNAGLKGYRIGSVGVYDKQALVLVNYANSTQKNILNLANFIQDKISNMYGIDLVIEPLIIK
jgi:UDP-N-acetylmuramate dehydrogenase